ncbi:uncharacterized protein LOC133202435 [Saccostrea echinata]|uniref:uncharacterized protein LOC133202435 n=1 Tax=Saccostrea echinata TaxID=191078 RepID=UPI002A81BFAC|nr:uncharacterized protein LOC133202435 [Saccostrea echinata]
MEISAFLLLTLVFVLTEVVNLAKGYECPRITYRRDSFGFIYKLRTYVHCEHGCCGQRGDYCCTAPITTTEKPIYNDNTSLYLGVVSGTVLAIVFIISVTCCCISKYNKKNVTVGVDPRRSDGSRAGVLTVQDLEDRVMSPPPAYEHTVSTAAPRSAPRDPSVRYTRTSGKLFTST